MVVGTVVMMVAMVIVIMIAMVVVILTFNIRGYFQGLYT